MLGLSKYEFPLCNCLGSQLGMDKGEFMGFIEVFHGDYSVIDNNSNILAFLNEYVVRSLKKYKEKDKDFEQ